MRSQRLCADKSNQLLRPIMDNEVSACIIAQNRKTKGIIGCAMWSLVIDSQYIHITTTILEYQIVRIVFI